MLFPVQVWFDGGTGTNTAEIGPLIREIAPSAMCHSCLNNFSGPEGGPVRWMGNEEGVMPLPSWGAAEELTSKVHQEIQAVNVILK